MLTRSFLVSFTVAALVGCLPADETPAQGAVTITVFEAGAPVAGAQVVFHTRAGTVTEERITDANGAVTRDIVEGDGATAAYVGITGTLTLASVLVLHPGVDVIIGNATPSPTVTGTVNVTFPAAVPGATLYDVNIGCANAFSAGVSASVNVTSGCSSIIDLVVTAYDTDFNILGASNVLDIDMSPGTVAVTLPPFDGTLPVLELELTNAPPNSSQVTAAAYARSKGFLYTADFFTSTLPVVEGSSAAFSFPYPPNLGGSVAYQSALFFTDDPGAFSFYAAARKGSPSAVTHDLTKDYLTRATNLGIDASDPDRLRMVWDGADDADVIFLDVFWSDGSNLGIWSLTIPGQRKGQQQFPVLPAALEQYRPANIGSAQITAVEAGFLDSHVETVPALFSLFPDTFDYSLTRNNWP